MSNQIKANKSFVLHTDNLEVVEELTDNQAGKLFKSILGYQKTGQINKLDQVGNIIFSQLIKQFERDKEKYRKSVIQGKLGNLKKYHKKIYKKVIDGEITLEKGEILAYPEKSIELNVLRPPIEPDRVGSHYVNVNVNDNINVNTNENAIKEKFEKIYRLYNQEKKIKVVPFDKLKSKFQSCLKEVTFEELRQSVEDYLDYLKVETWRKKKAFDAWINSPEFYANDWKNEKRGDASNKEIKADLSLVVRFNNFMNYEFANKIEEGDKVVVFLRSPNFKIQIDGDSSLQSKIKEFFKGKEVVLSC